MERFQNKRNYCFIFPPVDCWVYFLALNNEAARLAKQKQSGDPTNRVTKEQKIAAYDMKIRYFQWQPKKHTKIYKTALA